MPDFTPQPPFERLMMTPEPSLAGIIAIAKNQWSQQKPVGGHFISKTDFGFMCAYITQLQEQIAAKDHEIAELQKDVADTTEKFGAVCDDLDRYKQALEGVYALTGEGLGDQNVSKIAMRALRQQSPQS